MPIRYERPVSHAAYSSRRLAAFSLALFVLATGLHRFGGFETPNYIAVTLLAAAIAVLATLLAFLGLAMLWQKGARGGMRAAQALILVLPTLGVIGLFAHDYLNNPPIYDVATDTQRPPEWLVEPKADQSWLGPRLAPGETDRLLQHAAFPGLTGRRYEGGLDRVYTAARQAALDMGVTITDEKGAPSNELQALPAGKADETAADSLDNIPVPAPRPDIEDIDASQPGYSDAIIQGARRTTIFGFRQDIVIRLHEETETTLVDVRVAARYGQHDLGQSARLIEAYLRALDAALLGIAGG